MKRTHTGSDYMSVDGVEGLDGNQEEGAPLWIEQARRMECRRRWLVAIYRCVYVCRLGM